MLDTGVVPQPLLTAAAAVIVLTVMFAVGLGATPGTRRLSRSALDPLPTLRGLHYPRVEGSAAVELCQPQGVHDERFYPDRAE